MKKLTKLGLLAIMMLVVVMSLTGCAKKDSLEGLEVYTAEETPDYKTCDKVEGVEFKYPSNYTWAGKSDIPAYVDPDVLGATVNLVSDDFPKALTFEGYVDASISGIKANKTSMTVEGDINKKYINLNGTKAARLDYVASSKGIKMNITQVLIKKNDKAYALTLGALVGDEEAVSEKFEKIIKSFK